MKRKKKLSGCCISHEFSKTAAKNPNKIAVIHASGGAKLTREFRNATDTIIDYDSFYAGIAPSSHPPVYDGDRFFTFSQINSAIDSLTTRIRRVLDDPDLATSIGSGLGQYPKIIGLYIVPSVEYIIAVLSVLRCGEAFTPLNPMWPVERISFILSFSNACLLIRCQCYEPDKLQQKQCPELFISSINDSIEEECGSLNLPWPCEIENSRSFCYVMYTSGSTGKPKGVCGTETGLLNRFLWMQELYPLDGKEILFFKTPISFIDHLQEILGALLTASTLIIPPVNEIEKNQFFIYDFLQAYSINRLIAVPSLVRVILPALQSPYSKRVQNFLTLMVLSGEVFPMPLWETLNESLPKTIILNLYGSTEVSGDCLYFDCKKLPTILESETPSCVPIGTPISNCDIVLAGEDSPNQGEICVGGLATAIGYLGDLSIKSESFIKFPQGSYRDSVSEHESQYYFKSGDFAKRLKSGDLVFLGRKDRMVKVNGQRVALEEIETTLRGYEGVLDAVVISRNNQEVTFLEAYIITRPEVLSNKKLKYSIRSWMLGKLPLAMIPNCFFFIKSFPMSSSGKVDYDMLASMTSSMTHQHQESGDIQSTEYLQAIKKVFSDALTVEMVSDDGDFFQLGGNSITAAHVSHNLGIDMRLLYIFPSPMRLQMALMEKGDASCNGVRTSANKERLLLSFDTKALTNHKLKSSRRTYDNSDGNPTKHSKMASNLYVKCNALNYGDGYPWKSPSKYVACSISRCNKIFYACLHEANNLSQPNLSLQIPRDSRGVLRESWKIHLHSCVDASPLVVLKDHDFFLFVGAHSYRFFCIDVKSGSTRWEIKLEGRIECSAAAILDKFSQVVVGCYQGNIYFLDFSNGNKIWSFQTGGEVKSQPVVDKSRKLVWCGSYDHYIYGLDYVSHCCIYRFQCGGSVFGSPVIDEVRSTLYVASTNGLVTAITLTNSSPCCELWVCELKSPIFGSLSISFDRGIVICCLVDGHVVALNSNGTVFWKVKTGGPIFAGPCISQALASQVLICSRDGSIYSFELENGSLVWQYNLGDPITSSAFVDERLMLVSEHILDRLVCVCCSNGSVCLLRVPLERDSMAKNGVQEFASLKLQGDIFSSPVMIGGRIFVGCRDDYIQCLMLDYSYETSF